MAISLQTGLKQTQRLAMTQAMRQSLELLQMSALELQQAVQVELESNPVLEDDSSSPSADDERIDMILSMGLEDFEESGFSEDNYEDSDIDRRQRVIENAVVNRRSLYDHLVSQIRELSRPKKDLDLLERIATSLDSNGFYLQTREVFAAENKIPLYFANELFRVMHALDPIGCAALSVRESLLVQARIIYPDEDVLHSMIESHFDSLGSLMWERIAREMEVPVSYILQLSRLLQKLDPYPGRSFSVPLSEPVIPEAVVKLIEGEVVISFFDDAEPRLRINRYYAQMLRKKTIDKNLKDYIKERMDSARGLMKNIFDRRVTLEKVMKVVLDSQKDFLLKGPGNLKPLNYLAVSEIAGYHESTISRVIANKYIETDWGILPLRYFFSNRNVGGESNSLEDVLKLISDVVTQENPMSPYSDEDIVRLLKNSGFDVARRTVAKYRDILKIPSSGKRKRINMIRNEEAT